MQPFQPVPLPSIDLRQSNRQEPEDWIAALTQEPFVPDSAPAAAGPTPTRRAGSPAGAYHPPHHFRSLVGDGLPAGNDGAVRRLPGGQVLAPTAFADSVRRLGPPGSASSSRGNGWRPSSPTGKTVGRRTARAGTALGPSPSRRPHLSGSPAAADAIAGAFRWPLKTLSARSNVTLFYSAAHRLQKFCCTATASR